MKTDRMTPEEKKAYIRAIRQKAGSKGGSVKVKKGLARMDDDTKFAIQSSGGKATNQKRKREQENESN